MKIKHDISKSVGYSKSRIKRNRNTSDKQSNDISQRQKIANMKLKISR